MRVAVRKLGNSSGIIIPKAMLTELGVSPGDALDLSLEDGRIAITPIKRKPREGWAATYVADAALQDEDRDWFQFGNDEDAGSEW